MALPLIVKVTSRILIFSEVSTSIRPAVNSSTRGVSALTASSRGMRSIPTNDFGSVVTGVVGGGAYIDREDVKIVSIMMICKKVRDIPGSEFGVIALKPDTCIFVVPEVHYDFHPFRGGDDQPLEWHWGFKQPSIRTDLVKRGHVPSSGVRVRHRVAVV